MIAEQNETNEKNKINQDDDVTKKNTKMGKIKKRRK